MQHGGDTEARAEPWSGKISATSNVDMSADQAGGSAS